MLLQAELVDQVVVLGAAGGDALDVDGQAVAAVSTAKGGRHGAGVAPGFENGVDQVLLGAAAAGGEVGQQLRQSRR